VGTPSLDPFVFTEREIFERNLEVIRLKPVKYADIQVVDYWGDPVDSIEVLIRQVPGLEVTEKGSKGNIRLPVFENAYYTFTSDGFHKNGIGGGSLQSMGYTIEMRRHRDVQARVEGVDQLLDWELAMSRFGNLRIFSDTNTFWLPTSASGVVRDLVLSSPSGSITMAKLDLTQKVAPDLVFNPAKSSTQRVQILDVNGKPLGNAAVNVFVHSEDPWVAGYIQPLFEMQRNFANKSETYMTDDTGFFEIPIAGETQQWLQILYYKPGQAFIHGYFDTSADEVLSLQVDALVKVSLDYQLKSNAGRWAIRFDQDGGRFDFNLKAPFIGAPLETVYFLPEGAWNFSIEVDLPEFGHSIYELSRMGIRIAKGRDNVISDDLSQGVPVRLEFSKDGQPWANQKFLLEAQKNRRSYIILSDAEGSLEVDYLTTGEHRLYPLHEGEFRRSNTRFEKIYRHFSIEEANQDFRFDFERTGTVEISYLETDSSQRGRTFILYDFERDLHFSKNPGEGKTAFTFEHLPKGNYSVFMDFRPAFKGVGRVLQKVGAFSFDPNQEAKKAVELGDFQSRFTSRILVSDLSTGPVSALKLYRLSSDKVWEMVGRYIPDDNDACELAVEPGTYRILSVVKEQKHLQFQTTTLEAGDSYTFHHVLDLSEKLPAFHVHLKKGERLRSIKQVESDTTFRVPSMAAYRKRAFWFPMEFYHISRNKEGVCTAFQGLPFEGYILTVEDAQGNKKQYPVKPTAELSVIDLTDLN
jgi:hypothetical protein